MRIMKLSGVFLVFFVLSISQGREENEKKRRLRSSSGFDYGKLYGDLDSNEHYHNPQFALEVGMIPYIQKRYSQMHLDPQGARFVSLGCSLALGVERLADRGFDAHGVDVSEESIKEALGMGRGQRCAQKPCIQVGSLTELPFEDNSFPAGLSSDVLEHIHPDDVQQVVKEISRVVTDRLFLRISTVPEGRKMSLDGEPVLLHLTVKPASWWVEQFETIGNWRHVSGVLPPSSKSVAFIYLEKYDNYNF